MDSTFGTNIHLYKLIHVVCVDKYLRTHSVCFGLLSDLLAETMALFVDFFAKIMDDTTKKTEVVSWTKRGLNTRTYGSTFPWLEYFYATSMHFRPLDDAPICRIPICNMLTYHWLVP